MRTSMSEPEFPPSRGAAAMGMGVVRRAAFFFSLLSVPAILVAGASQPLSAQSSSTPLSAHDSALLDQFVGAWQGARGALPAGLKIVNPYQELEKVSTAHLQPWARERQESTEWDVDDTGAVCKRDGIFRQGLATGFGMSFVRVPGKLVWVGDVDEIATRDFYLNSPHPADLEPTWDGDARAHFDGDTLVVDTIGFNDKSWLGSDRQPHTESLHVIEFMTLHDNGQYLEDRVVVDDRRALTAPYSFIRVYKKQVLDPNKADASFGPAAPGVGGAKSEDICNQSKIGHDPWRRKREGILADHQEQLNAYIQQVRSEK